MNNELTPYSENILPDGIESRLIKNVNGLDMHILEAGRKSNTGECIILLHGFPELAYSWRKIIPNLAEQGYHVIAPDQRGYGRTTGWSKKYHDDLAPFKIPNLVKDIEALVSILGYETVKTVVGHDFGTAVAAWCSLIKPDIFKSVVLMSAPFGGPPGKNFSSTKRVRNNIHRDLALLERPRKHYQWYYSTEPANSDMVNCPQGLHNFLRAYYHMKSGDWLENEPFPLEQWEATELAKMPTYYIMDLKENMAQTVEHHKPTEDEIKNCIWLQEHELKVYSEEYSRNGFQGGLQWYRCNTDPNIVEELTLFSGSTIDVNSIFIAGAKDWGIYQNPGAIETMQSTACSKMQACHLVSGAGHWVQQEKPTEVSNLLLDFIDKQ